MPNFEGVENFESYADGDDIFGGWGGSGWVTGWYSTGLGQAKVSSETSYNGSKSLKLTGTSSSRRTVQRTFVHTSSGSIYIAFRASTIAINAPLIMLGSGSGDQFEVSIRSQSGVKGAYIMLATFPYVVMIGTPIVNNTWYILNMEWDLALQPNKFRARIHQDGAWSAFTDWKTGISSLTYVDTLRIVGVTTTSPATYFDTIQFTDPTIPIGPPQSTSVVPGPRRSIVTS